MVIPDESPIETPEREAMKTLFAHIDDHEASIMLLVKADPTGLVDHGVVVLRGAKMVAAMALLIDKTFVEEKKELRN